MGTIGKYKTLAGREGYIARDSWIDANGVRQHRKHRVAKTQARNLETCKEEARAWLAQREADRSRGVFFEPSREPFGVVLDRWLETRKHSVSPATIGVYKQTAKSRFDEAFRGVPLCEVTPAAINRLVDQWTTAKKQPETIMQAFKVLHGVFRMAIDERDLLENPMQRVKAPSVKPPKMVIWTPQQVQHFLTETASDDWHDAWLMLFATLTRIGELAALRWDDVDWRASTITVQRTWTRDDGRDRIIVERTKTDRSTRIIPLPSAVLDRLGARQAEQTNADGGWIFAIDGEAVPAGHLRKKWNAAVTKTGLPRITPHGARHTGASNMIQAGVPPTVVQRIVGHTNPAFTMHRYVHHQSDDLADAVQLLDGLYRGDLELSRVQSAPKVISIEEKRRKDRGEKSS